LKSLTCGYAETACIMSGIGKRIMVHTLQAVWDAGCYKVMLMTGSGNPGTHAFYRACGLSADYKTAYMARRP